MELNTFRNREYSTLPGTGYGMGVEVGADVAVGSIVLQANTTISAGSSRSSGKEFCFILFLSKNSLPNCTPSRNIRDLSSTSPSKIEDYLHPITTNVVPF